MRNIYVYLLYLAWDIKSHPRIYAETIQPTVKWGSDSLLTIICKATKLISHINNNNNNNNNKGTCKSQIIIIIIPNL